MSSATGNPQDNPRSQDRDGVRDGDRDGDEFEPLLGRPGDASQKDGKAIQYNFIIGTAILAQFGIWILTATIWAAIFIHPPLILFSGHPLLNSAGLLLLTQGILVLQPTHTQPQKKLGTTIHAILNGTGTLALIAGFIVIEVNKFKNGAVHFTSLHGRLGLATYILFTLQALVGVAQYYTPLLFGSVDNAKAIYKYHRATGYLILVVGLVTVGTATQTGLNISKLHIQLWAVIVTSILTLVGIVPRIKKRKFGF